MLTQVLIPGNDGIIGRPVVPSRSGGRTKVEKGVEQGVEQAGATILADVDKAAASGPGVTAMQQEMPHAP